MFREELFDGYVICCDVIRMGEDYTLAVYGGGRPHVGSVVMAIARPSLSGEGISACTFTGKRICAEEMSARVSASMAPVSSCAITVTSHSPFVTPEIVRMSPSREQDNMSGSEL